MLAPTRLLLAADYFILPRDGVIARVLDGCVRQVWQPDAGQWADFDFDVAGEANAVPRDMVERLGADVSDDVDDGEPAEASDSGGQE